MNAIEMLPVPHLYMVSGRRKHPVRVRFDECRRLGHFTISQPFLYLMKLVIKVGKVYNKTTKTDDEVTFDT